MPQEREPCVKGKIRNGPLLRDGKTRRCVVPCNLVSKTTLRKAKELTDRCRSRREGSGIDKLLSDKEVLKLSGKDSKVITYPELQDYDDLDDLFGNKNKIIILYLNEKNGNSFVGHWVLLLRNKRNGKTIIEFNDSYSNEIDEYFDDIPDENRENLDQSGGFLSKLLYDYDNNNDDVEIHYNEYPLQKKGRGINTCGRWVGLRGRFSKIPLEKYQSIFKKLKNDGEDLDKIVTLATDELLK
jgi:hypothetical protein